MQGKKQLEQDTTVGAPIEAVYGLFMDNAELANWAPAVDAVTAENGGDETGLGATRTCAVTMNGAKGTMTERCIEAVPPARASFLVVDDSFGFTTMFTGYGFTAHFTPAAGGRTTVRIETFYTPANPVTAVLNKLVIRRRLRSVVDELLAGLRTLAEQRQAHPKTSPRHADTPGQGRPGVMFPPWGTPVPAGPATGCRGCHCRPQSAPPLLSCPAAGPGIEVTEGDRAAAPSRRYGLPSRPPSILGR